MQRRILFLNYILNYLIYKVLDAQVRKPCKHYWVNAVKRDLIELELTIEDIQAATQYQLQNYVRKVKLNM